MATQHCPRCKSNRIRHGYRPTPFFQRLIFRFNLLCNDCNWEFVGFAIPGTVSSKTKRKKKTEQFNEPPKFERNLKLVNDQSEKIDSAEIVQSENGEIGEIGVAQDLESSQTGEKTKSKVRKRVRVNL